MHRYLDEATTCRQLIYDAISDAAYASIRGSPWAVEVEVALGNLRLAVDNAIDADPVLKEIFDRRLQADDPEPQPDYAAEYVGYAAAWIDAVGDADAGERRWKNEKTMRNKASVGAEDREALMERLARKFPQVFPTFFDF